MTKDQLFGRCLSLEISFNINMVHKDVHMLCVQVPMCTLVHTPTKVLHVHCDGFKNEW